MKIAIFGSTGNIGQRIAREAAARGHEVVGIVRDPAASTSDYPLVQGDATDAASVARVAQGVDVVVSAISPRPNARGLAAPRLADAAHALIDGLARAGAPRLLVVGGAATLEVAPGVRLLDTPEFPDAYKGEANEGAEALAVYREHGAPVPWTFVSPAAEIGPGERTGRYRVTDDTALFDANGRSFISYDDYAVAILDEIERPTHVRRRMGVAY